MTRCPGVCGNLSSLAAIAAAVLAVSASWCQRKHPLPSDILRERFPDTAPGLELSGCTAVVTGGNAGIGLETAKALARAGAEVVLGCRSLTKCASARREIEVACADLGEPPRVTALELDLEDLASVRTFAQEVSDLVGSNGLQLLILNAGVTGVGWLEVRRGARTGQELRFATNHLGHFYLAQKLRRSMLTSAAASAGFGPSRVVVVASRSHKFSPALPVGPIEALPTEEMLQPTWPHWLPVRRDLQLYGLSKLCNAMFARELQRRWGQEVVSVSLHPGSSMLTNGGESTLLVRLWLRVVSPWTKSVAQGAATTVFAAVDQSLKGGEYLSDCVVSTDVHPDLWDNEKARELWDFSRKLLLNLTGDHDT